jgi:hypothetical protein
VVVKGAQCPWVEGRAAVARKARSRVAPSGVGGVVEEVSGGDGVAAGVGEIARARICHGEISQREDAGTAGGRGQLIERGGGCGSDGTVVAGLEVNVAGGSERVGGTVVDQ